MKKFSARYHVPDLHPHKLRHTFISIAITSGADIASVSEKLGRSDKAVTLRMYTHADQESMTRASQIFRNALKNDKKSRAGELSPGSGVFLSGCRAAYSVAAKAPSRLQASSTIS